MKLKDLLGSKMPEYCQCHVDWKNCVRHEIRNQALQELGEIDVPTLDKSEALKLLRETIDPTLSISPEYIVDILSNLALPPMRLDEKEVINCLLLGCTDSKSVKVATAMAKAICARFAKPEIQTKQLVSIESKDGYKPEVQRLDVKKLREVILDYLVKRKTIYENLGLTDLSKTICERFSPVCLPSVEDIANVIHSDKNANVLYRHAYVIAQAIRAFIGGEK